MRADLYLVSRTYAESRSKAKNLIESSAIKIDGRIIDKPSFDIDESLEHTVEVLQEERYVSRGGLKLEGALDTFGINVKELVAVDIGASTGGFSDCLLQRGAKRIYAVDSGSSQLHSKLKNDVRVISMEKFNARNISRGDIGERADIVVMDVSFISQTCIIPALATLIDDGGCFVSLIKPQFEAGREAIGKGGLVKKGKDRYRSVCRVLESAESSQLGCRGLCVSPIQGGDGNIEYLAYFVKGETHSPKVCDEYIKKLTEA